MSESINHDLILEVLFNHLPLNDLIRYRLVSIKWKSMIDQYISRKEELILFFNSKPHQWYWVYENKPINVLNVASATKGLLLKSDYLKKNFKSIKRLLILTHSRFLSNKLLNSLLNEHFEDLEHLQINYLFVNASPSIRDNQYICNLKLAKLKTLYADYGVKLGEIHCNNLEMLTLKDEFQRKKQLPFFDKIKYLDVECLSDFFTDAAFPALEVLITKKLPRTPTHSREHFPNLKKRCFNLNYIYDANWSANNFFNDLRSTDLYVMLRQWSLINVETFVNCIKLENEWKDISLREVFFGTFIHLDSALKLYNEDRFEIDLSINTIGELEYTDLLGKILKKVDFEILEKHGRIYKKMYFRQPFTDDKNFLNSKKYFDSILHITVDTSLSQDQLDMLPQFAPLLKEIIFTPKCKGDKIDYNFLTQFEHLLHLKSEDKNLLRNLRELVENCKRTVRVKLSCYNFHLKIKSPEYVSLKDSDKKQVFKSYDEFLSHLNEKYPDQYTPAKLLSIF